MVRNAMTRHDEPQTPRVDREVYRVSARDIGFEVVNPALARQLELELRGSLRIIDELKMANAELEKDAARYRFIRNLIAVEDIERLISDGNPIPDERESLMTDTAVDAALKP